MTETSETGTPIIIIRNLTKSYVSRNYGFFGNKDITPVLHNFNLDIAAGEIFGISGESGCGKSTLARCITGLVDYEGDITIDGRLQQPGNINPAAQMIFQDPGASLSPTKKAGWLMEEPLVIHRRLSNKARGTSNGTAVERARKADEMLVRVGLDPLYRNRRVHELSGGQKQRVCIGRALMLEPKILIADEAISSLDVSAGAQILNLFRELRDSLGLTIIFISHDRNAADYLCDRVVVMGSAVSIQK